MSIGAIAWLAGAYLLGAVRSASFSQGFWGRRCSVVGGNIGATNVLRAAGRSAAVLTLIADCLKGLLPVLIAPHIASDASLPVLTGIAAVVGHNFLSTWDSKAERVWRRASASSCGLAMDRLACLLAGWVRHSSGAIPRWQRWSPFVSPLPRSPRQ